MTSPSFIPSLLNSLEKAQLSSLPLAAWPIDTTYFAQRKRGLKGRKEAAQRVVIDGSGPGAGMNPRGCDVVLEGVPHFIDEEAMKKYLNRLKVVKMRRDGELDCEVISLPMYVCPLFRRCAGSRVS